MAGLLSKIKDDIKNSGSNRSKIWYVREGEKARVRFLQELDDGISVTFHNKYAPNRKDGFNVPCQEQFGRECAHHDDEDARTREMYAWTVWDYDAEDVKVFLFAVNQCSPVSALIAMSETYGTITDRDYIISFSGKGTSKTYSVIPMDKSTFRNKKAKKLSDSKLMDIIDKAYPDSDSESDDDEYEDVKKARAKVKGKVVDDGEDYPEEWDEEEEEETSEYESMGVKDLFKECKKRGIEVEPKKAKAYYVKKLEDYDQADDDWDDEDEDDWEDED